MTHRILYLQIEIKAREFLGRALLAAKAAERGWLVLMGDMPTIERALRHNPPGVYVELSIPEKKAGALAALRARGHRPVNLCEENVVYTDGREYCERKVGESALAETDLLFASGERNADDLRRHRPESRSKIVVAGNPRFDTLLPTLREVYEPEARALRERHGRFLLVNTNFGRVNPFHPGTDVFDQLVRQGLVRSEEHASYMRRLIDYKHRQMDALRTMLSRIAQARAFDRIIVRPHPVENHRLWRKWAKPHGIEVRYEGNANTWILASDAILHTGCTTGIEGLLLDRPVASFVPEPESELLNLSDAISAHVADAPEFLARAAEWRHLGRADIRERFADHRQTLARHICNVEPPLSADRILDALDTLELPGYRLADLELGESTAFGLLGRRVGKVLRTLQPGRRRRRDRNRALQKHPGITLGELQQPLNRWLDSGVLSHIPAIRRGGDGLWLIGDD